MKDHDTPIVVLKWSDGSHAVFVESDRVALENYINRKVEREGETARDYTLLKALKHEYDALKGL